AREKGAPDRAAGGGGGGAPAVGADLKAGVGKDAPDVLGQPAFVRECDSKHEGPLSRLETKEGPRGAPHGGGALEGPVGTTRCQRGRVSSARHTAMRVHRPDGAGAVGGQVMGQ